MKPGLYRLTQDVENPEADRRHKDDWRLQTQWNAGLLFRLRVNKEEPIASGIECETVEIFRVPHRWSHHRIILGRIWSGARAKELGFQINDDARAQALTPSLEAVPLDNLEAGLAYYHKSLPGSTNLLRVLVGEGFVTETQALAIMGKLDRDEYDEKYWPDED